MLFDYTVLFFFNYSRDINKFVMKKSSLISPASIATRKMRFHILISWSDMLLLENSSHNSQFIVSSRSISWRLISMTIIHEDWSSRILCKHDTRIVRYNHSDIYSSRRFDDTAVIYFCKTANHEICSEISSRSSRSHRTWYKESTFHKNIILRLIILSWYYHIYVERVSVFKKRDREEDRSDT